MLEDLQACLAAGELGLMGCAGQIIPFKKVIGGVVIFTIVAAAMTFTRKGSSSDDPFGSWSDGGGCGGGD